MVTDTMQHEFLLVMTSCPDKKSATTLAQALVEAKLAACIQISSEITSIYQWEQQLCEETEFSLQIKCAAQDYHLLEQFIGQRHPYQVPEIIAIPIIKGSQAYLDWIKDSTKR